MFLVWVFQHFSILAANHNQIIYKFEPKMQDTIITFAHIQMLHATLCQSPGIMSFFFVLFSCSIVSPTTLLLNQQLAEFKRVMAFLLLLALRSDYVSLWQSMAG